MIGHGDGGLRGRFVPRLGDGHAALVTHAAVVRRERRAHDIDRRDARGGEVAGGDGFRRAMRRLPEEGDGGDLVLLLLEALDAQRVTPPADESERGLVFAEHARGNGAVEERLVVVVEPEARAVGRVQCEFVLARLPGDERTAPLHGETVGAGLLRQGSIRAIIEVHLPVHPRLDLVVEVARGEIIGAEAGFAVAGLFSAAEAAEQIGDGVHILAVGEADEFDARGVVAGARFAGVEGVMDVARHGGGVRADAFLRRFLGHVLVDVARELLDGPVAVQRIIVLFLHALAILSVALHALLLVNRAAIRRRFDSAKARDAAKGGEQKQRADAGRWKPEWIHQCCLSARGNASCLTFAQGIASPNAALTVARRGVFDQQRLWQSSARSLGMPRPAPFKRGTARA